MSQIIKQFNLEEELCPYKCSTTFGALVPHCGAVVQLFFLIFSSPALPA